MKDTHSNLLTLAYLCFLNDNFGPLRNALKFTQIEDDMIINFNYAVIESYLPCIKDESKLENSFVQMIKIARLILDLYIGNVNYVTNIEGIYFLTDDDIDSLKSENIDNILLNGKEIVKRAKIKAIDFKNMAC